MNKIATHRTKTIDPAAMADEAPWPAVVLTADDRILHVNGLAAAALDPGGEGILGLRLGFALEDQGLAGARMVRAPLPIADGADSEAAAVLALLQFDEAPAARPSAGADRTAAALSAGLDELCEALAEEDGARRAQPLARIAAELARAVATPPNAAGAQDGCDVEAVVAALRRDWTPRFAARGRAFEVALAPDAPRRAAVAEEALKSCITDLLALALADDDPGDADVTVAGAGPGLRIEVAATAASASSRTALLMCELARLRLRDGDGDATPSHSGEALRIRFDLAADDHPDHGAVAATAAELPDLSHLSILIAEDNLTNQLVATEMLRGMGAEVEVASDGAEALEMLEGRLYDLLLIDIEMPRVTGLEVIRRVREGAGPQAARPVIALTAYAMAEHRARIMEAGADGLIPKPILSIGDFGRTLLDFAAERASASPPETATPPAPASAPAPAPGAGEDAESPIDAQVFEALAAAIGPESVGELLAKVTRDFASVRDEIARGAEDGDLMAIRRATHILVSVAGAIGAVRLQGLAQRLNALAHDEDTLSVQETAAETLTELASVLLCVERKSGDPAA